MDNSIVEENGNSSAASGSNDVVDVVAQQAAAGGGGVGVGVGGGGGGGGNPQQQQQQQQNPQSTTAGGPTGATNNAQGGGGGGAATVLTTAANCNLQYPIQTLAQHGLQVQSVIQANPSGVIQTAAGTQQQQQQQALAAATAMHKVVYVAKPPNSTVIHTTPGNAVQVRNKIPPTFPCKIKPEPTTQHPEDSDESLSDDDSQHHRSELTRRPSYNKIFTEISGPDISGASLPLSDGVLNSQLAGSGAGGNAANNSLMQLDPTYYLTNRMSYNTNNSGIAEDQTRKREIRLQKNREAARECRRKKKEYIKCLENRVAVLENQNKALIEELKSLKELYCQTKND
ncbi:cyclic AMP response element-binding protein B isoform X1 [Drosophila elegans]|uniref:cyclic AMP response element-binding protein B isoform X1 n=1 Tax=Drosophila elegans TaxID=30023 RepID=UPI0007E8145A|nr:cyclic AMP response element-binding protein B isoform X1 [Drosophila elegans]XP_017113267.1 cyclic AMP response element-binding protein B isoform X1 [Drosophila elegans]XP_017113268.1 cyclic AMP response element-binding protein B isoform X1 [Drosophila elegans]XP_041564506.1 cyclic AMP response element-binding protein B isoform X1 [Drosophila elegans]